MNKYLKALKKTENKYDSILHLTANENIMSPLAKIYYASQLGYRYNMLPLHNEEVFKSGNFAAKGMPELQDILNEGISKASKMLNAEFATLSCLSGVHAMMSSIISCTKVGDTIMTVPSKQGGHFCTKGVIELTGRKQILSEYDFENLTFDVEKLAKVFKENNAKALYLDTSVYVKPHPIREIRKALGEDAIIIYDASHTLGLIMGGQFQDPLKEGANVISSNTHKTLPGPHKGLIAFRDKDFGEKAESIIRGSLYSTIQSASTLALAITIIEFEKFGEEYAKQVIANSNALAKAIEKKGFEVRKINDNCYSMTHQAHIFIEKDNVELVQQFLKNNISINTSRALGEKLFMRVGTQELTKLGMKEPDMRIIADFIKRVLDGENIGNEVINFKKKFNKVHYCFDV